MQEKSRETGNGIFGIIAVSIVLILMGVPFVGMTVMTLMMLAPNSNFGLPVAIGILVIVFLISDFTGALIAATGAGLLTACIRSGRSFRFSVIAASTATALASVFGTFLMPDRSLLSGDNVETLVQLYGSAGMNSSEIVSVLNILMYILPSLLVLWATVGVIASASAVKLIGRRKGLEVDIPDDRPLKLGLLPAWILIAALAVNLSGSGLHPYFRQAAVNVSIFMILPYSAVGLAVFRKILLMFPQVLMLAVLVVIVFPPLALGMLMITGILDTWFDFRTRLISMKERKNTQ